MTSPVSRGPVSQGYGAVSRINHWVIGIAVIGMLSLGLYLEFGGLAREDKGWLRDVHKSTGVLVLIYGVWRVGWRLKQGFPDPVGAMPAWQEKAATYSHRFLLAAIVLMPLSGLLWSLFSDRAVDVFGWFTIPAFGEVAWLGSSFHFVHTWLGYSFAAVVLIHVAGALKHHLVDRDGTLLRMINGKAVAGRAD